MLGQRALDQGDGDARVFDDQYAVLFRLVVLHKIKYAVEYAGGTIFLRNCEINANAHQRDDRFDGRHRTEIDQLAGRTLLADASDAGMFSQRR